MERLIPALYKDYGLYKNKRQMFPNFRDGLLPVQKRILLAAHTIAKNKFVKTAKVLGETMARWHPHSEALGTAEWAVNNDFLDGGGLWGSSIGTGKIGCAKPRYTSLKANSFIENLAFKYVNFVRWIPDEADPEPIAIPTMLPFCLIAKHESVSIGFGFRTEIPCYDKFDLINRLLYLLNKQDKVIIKPRIEGCKILSSNKDCEKILTDGKGIISIQGRIRVNEKSKKISIFGWSPRSSFTSLLNKVDKYNNWGLLTRGDIGYIDESDGNTGTQVDFEIGKQRNKEQIFNKMKEAISESLKAKLTYNIITIDNGNISFPSIDDMLLASYSFYRGAKKTYIDKKIEGLDEIMVELETIKMIRPHISKISNSKQKLDDIYRRLAEMTGCQVDNIKKVVEKYKIKRLLSVSTDVTNIKEELKRSKKGLKNIEEHCYNDYQSLE